MFFLRLKIIRLLILFFLIFNSLGCLNKKENKQEVIEKDEEDKFTGITFTFKDSTIVNLLSGDNRLICNFNIVLELDTEETYLEIATLTSRLRHIMIMTVSCKKLEEVLDIKGKERVAEELRININKILKKGFIKRVLFSDFMVT